ncbi:MAG: DNA alkylation repair enzyme [Promethearchaeota archaeon]|nr:MAG: DNA alkylation repair enzyme [Candidatus Lokiarchaeota archaeon]
MKKAIINEIKQRLKATAPDLTDEQIKRRNKILNSFNPDFFGYGHKVADLEKLARTIENKYECTYEDAVKIFNTLISSNIHEEKFISFLFINRFKRYFDEEIVRIYREALENYCDSWAVCDSSIIKVLGPFIAKKLKKEKAYDIISEWSKSDNIWIRRASLVIFIKHVMITKKFEKDFLSNLVDALAKDSEEYVQKAIGWLLKTCSQYAQNYIFGYLMDRKDLFSRMVLRTATEKLSKELRTKILEK